MNEEKKLSHRQDLPPSFDLATALDLSSKPDFSQPHKTIRARQYAERMSAALYGNALAIKPGEELKTIVPPPPDEPELVVSPQPTQLKIEKETTPLSPEEKLDKELERIAKNIVKLSVHTKFPAGAKIKWKDRDVLIDKLIFFKAGKSGASGYDDAEIDQGEFKLRHSFEMDNLISQIRGNKEHRSELHSTLFFTYFPLEISNDAMNDPAFDSYKDSDQTCYILDVGGIQCSNIFAKGSGDDRAADTVEGTPIFFRFMFKDKSSFNEFIDCVFQKGKKEVPLRLRLFLEKACPNLIVTDKGQLQAEMIPDQDDYKRDENGVIIVTDQAGNRVYPGITMRPTTKVVAVSFDDPGFLINTPRNWYTQSNPNRIWELDNPEKNS